MRLSCRPKEPSWLFFKDGFLKGQEQSSPMCRELCENDRRPAWMNRDLLSELRHKKKVSSVSQGELPSRNIQILPNNVAMELGNRKLI